MSKKERRYKMKKKKIAIIVSIILVLVALMISGSYALFYHENTAKLKESYSTGLLNIVAKSKTDKDRKSVV